MMRWFAHCAIVIFFVSVVNGAPEGLPDYLRYGKMRQYPACRALFNQSAKSYAVVKEQVSETFNRVCNCSFSRNPPQSGLSITCALNREVYIPVTLGSYARADEVVYLIVRYRIKGSSNPWQEVRVKKGNSRAEIDLTYENGVSHVYAVEVYAVLNDQTRERISSDDISSATGLSVHRNPIFYPSQGETFHTQNAIDFSMSFEKITDTSMDIVFQTSHPSIFSVRYGRNGQLLDINFDQSGHALLTGLEPNTKYTFIVYQVMEGTRRELKRHDVKTLPQQRIIINNPQVVIPAPSDITLECPILRRAAIQTINWYRVLTGGATQRLATYDVETEKTEYPDSRDPRIEVINGQVLRIRNAGADDAGRYRCTYSIPGQGEYQLQRVTIIQPVSAYITWSQIPEMTEYIIEYRPASAIGDQWQTLSVNTDRAGYLISGLQPLTEYVFRIYDFTDQIRGELIDTVRVTTTTESESEPASSPCDELQCDHGHCELTPHPRCVCYQGYAGRRCETLRNYCESEPCQNYGTCIPRNGGHACQCQRGFTGRNCETVENPCNPNPCENGGVCVSAFGVGYSCTCRRGFSGTRCSRVAPISPCQDNPCVHGTCYVLGRNYDCQCEQGFYGRNCDNIDTAPSIALRCPISEDEFGSVESIEWSRISQNGRIQPIYNYNAGIRNASPSSIYRNRLSSPQQDTLIIRNAQSSDVGEYECNVEYDSGVRKSSRGMQLVQVPQRDSRVTISWEPSTQDFDFYRVRYRNVNHDEDFDEVLIPPDSTRHILTNLRPDAIYEVKVISYARAGNVEQPIEIELIPGDAPTTTTAAPTTTTRARPRGDSIPEKTIDDIPVAVIANRFGPIPVNTPVGLVCHHRNYGERKTRYVWTKESNGKIENVFSNTSSVWIPSFSKSDEGLYRCSVEIELTSSIKIGQGQINVISTSQIPPPYNLRIEVTSDKTASLTWSPPRSYTGLRYVVTYYPIIRRFGEKENVTVNTPHAVLDHLLEGMEYDVEIMAYKAGTASLPLNGHFVQQVERIPSPINFQVKMLSDTEAKVTWDQLNTSGISGYKLQYWDVTRPIDESAVERTSTTMSMILTNLVNGKTYQVWIYAMEGEKMSPQLSSQFRKTPANRPLAPSSISFKDIESDRVTVYWDHPAGWTPDMKYSLVVQSQDEDFPFTSSLTEYAPKTRTVSSLRPGTTYLVTVRSVRNEVPSEPVYGYVKTDEVIKLFAPYPEKLILECNTRINSRIYEVAWFKYNNDGEAKRIYVTRMTSTRNDSMPDPNDTQFVGRLSASSLTNLEIRNVQYPADFGKYKCEAKSPSRRGFNVIDLVATYPDSIASPVGFNYEVINDTTARVRWSHPYGEDITAYSVTYGPTLDIFGTEKTIVVQAPVIILKDLVAGTEYRAIIKAKILKEESDDSLIGTFLISEDQVKNIEVERLPNGNDLLLSWENPDNILGISFALRNSLDNPWQVQPVLSPETDNIKFQYPMEDGDSVFFRLSALTSNHDTPVVVKYTEGDGAEVAELDGSMERIPEPTERVPTFEEEVDRNRVAYPSPVSNLVLENPFEDVLTASWNPTPDVYFDYYRVTVSGIDSDTSITSKTNTTSYQTQLRNQPGESFNVSVSTVRNGAFSFSVSDIIRMSYGELDISTTADISIVESEPPKPPKNLQFSSVMRSRFTATWQSDDDDVTDFAINYRPSDGSSEWVEQTTDGLTTATVRSLQPDTEYEILVYAVSNVKSTPTKGTVRTRTRRPTSRPTSLRVVGKTNETINLEWAGSNNEHKIEVIPTRGSGERQRYDVDAGQFSYLIPNLEPGMSYRIYVIPYERNNPGRRSNIRATTKPNQPRNPRVVSLRPDSAVLMWDEPISTLITGYRVIYYPTSTFVTKAVDATTNRIEIHDLEPATVYKISILSKQGNEESAPTEISIETPKETLSSPTVSGASVNDDEILLEWQPVPGADSQQVTFYPEDDELSSITHGIDNISGSFRIPNVLPGHYVVNIVAIKDGQPSPPAEVPITMPVKVPENLDVSALSSDEITATWDEPEDLGYSPTYDVIAIPTGVLNPIEVPTEKRTSDHTYTFTRLEPETEYTVQVIARYGDMKSSPANQTVTTLGDLESVTNLEFSDVSQNSFILEWTSPRSRALYRYEIKVRPEDSDIWQITEETTNNWILISDLNPATPYIVEVNSLLGSRRGEPVPATITTKISAPTTFKKTDTSEDTVVVVWDPLPTTSDIIYEVTATNTDDLTWTPIVIETRDNTATFENLEPGQTYTIQIVARNGDQMSEPMTIQVGTDAPTPEDLDTEITEEGTIHVTWQPVSGASSYSIEYYSSDSAESVILIANGTTDGVILNDLNPDTEYIIHITSLVNDVVSEPSTVIITTPIEEPDVKEVNLRTPTTESEGARSSSVDISWDIDDTEDSDVQYEITYYTMDEVGDRLVKGSPQEIIVPGIDGQISIDDLLPSTEYVIEVRSIKDSGKSKPNVIKVTTPVDQPLISEIQPDVDEVTLNWQQPQGEVNGYEITVIPSEGPSFVVPVDGSRNSVTIPGLEPDTEYDVRIIALSDVRDSEPIVTKFTTEPADVRPSNAMLTKLPNGTYFVRWDAPSRNVLYYIVHYNATDGTPSRNTIQVFPGSTEVMLPQLVPGTDYEVTIQSLTKPTDDVTELNTISRQISTDIPALPDSIMEQNVSDDTVTIYWDAPDQERYLSGYRVQIFREGSNSAIQALEIPRSSNTATFRDLKPNTRYTVKVTPHIDFRPGESATRTITTDEILDVPAPHEIFPTEVTPDDIVISWDVPENYDQITHYEIKLYDDYGAEINTFRIEGDRNDFTIPDLEPSTYYRISVIPYINDRSGPSVDLTESTMPKTPENVRANSVQSDQVEILWEPSAEDSFYTIEVVPTDNQDAETLFFETESSSILIPDLLPETSYEVIVTASGPFGKESYPGRFEFRTPREPEVSTSGGPISPEGSISFTPDQEDIIISWVSSPDPSVESYQIFYTTPGQQPQVITVPAGAEETIVSSLLPGRSYDFWVRGILPIGETVPVTMRRPHTPTVISPDNYSPLTEEPVEVPEDGKIFINWEGIGREATLYGVTYRNVETDEAYEIVVPGTYSNTVLSGLNPGDEYYIEVIGMYDNNPRLLPNVNVGTSDFVLNEHSMLATSPTGSFVIQWQPDSDNPNSDRVIGYAVTYELKCCLGEPEMLMVPANTTLTTLELEPNTEYVFSVEGKTPDGQNVPVNNIWINGESLVRPVQPMLPTPFQPLPEVPDDEDTIEPTPPTVITLSPSAVSPLNPNHQDPLENTNREVPTTISQAAKTTRHPLQTHSVEEVTEARTESTTPAEEAPNVAVLPTFDGNVIINWTPLEVETDGFILQYTPQDGRSPTQTVRVDGDNPWISIPEPETDSGYDITIYSVVDGSTAPIYNARLDKSPQTGDFHLVYNPVSTSRPSVHTDVITHETVVPARRTEDNLPDNEYTFNTGENTDREYERWLTPEVDSNDRYVTLQWNPDKNNIAAPRQRILVRLVPINDSSSQTITRVISSSGGRITGLKPGVRYQLFARYLQRGISDRYGKLPSFTLPAFSSNGVPITEPTYGISEVWMNQLFSGGLLLQWNANPESTSYRVEYRQSSEDVWHTRTLPANRRWIVLPKLMPGDSYAINIYATVDGILSKIYTITVTRKITGPQLPSKIEWYNMYGDSVDLSWLSPPGKITGYRISYRLESENVETQTTVLLPSNTTTYHMTNLLPGEVYLITVQTQRGEEYSDPFTFRLRMIVPTVRKIYFQQTGAGTVVIRWPALPDFVTGYSVHVSQVSPIGPDLVPGEVLSADTLEYTIRGLKPSVIYEFTIQTMVNDITSEPVTLQLWTLQQDSQISRTSLTGDWTINWSPSRLEIDNWKIEVRVRGDEKIIYSDNLDPTVTSYQLHGLEKDQDYVVSIYAVRGGDVSSPIQVSLPGSTRPQGPQIPQSGARLLERISLQTSSDRIVIQLHKTVRVDNYEIKYKTSQMINYTSRGVEISRGEEYDTATVTNLQPGQTYQFSVTAIKGSDRSTMTFNVDTQELSPLQNIKWYSTPDQSQIRIAWPRPRTDVNYYKVSYTYSNSGETVTRTPVNPEIFVPMIAQGDSAKFTLSYVINGHESLPTSWTISVRQPESAPDYTDDYGEQP